MNNLGKMKTNVKRDDHAAETHQEKSRSCQAAFSVCFGLAQTRYKAARAKEEGEGGSLAIERLSERTEEKK